MGSDPIYTATQGVESTRRWGLTPFAWALRLLVGAALLWCVALAVSAPELPRVCAVAAAVIFAITLWRPGPGLILVVGLAPAGALFASPPAHAAELFAWAFLAGWFLRLWRPLTTAAWPRAILIPAALYCGAVVASWLALALSGAAGVPPPALPLFLLQSIPQDHLILSSPEAATSTLLQIVTGVAIFLAALGLTRDDPRLLRSMAWALVASLAVLALATLLDVIRQWAIAGYGAEFLLRYVRGERFSLHLPDLNATGSLYVLAALTAITLALFDRERRTRWIGLLLVMLPALWLAGSRTSFVAAIAGLGILAAAQSRWQPTRRHAVAGAAVLLVGLAAAALVADWRIDVGESAGRAVNLRSQFSETSARMFISSPVFGVGVGRYFDRSAEFMSDELRGLYGNENAHNYFFQQFAELGVVGGLLFVWLVAAVVFRGWRDIRQSSAGDGVLVGLFAGAAGYLLTCLTGHPLLVSEAALPFWAAFGAVAGTGRAGMPARGVHGAVALVTAALLMIGIGQAAASYARTNTMPPEQGFHGLETAADGTRFRWMTRHGVTYIPDGPGFVRLTLRTPDQRLLRPLIVETMVAGRVADRRELPRGRWVTYDIPIRQAEPLPFRRVDLRVNQSWVEDVRLGRRAAQRPIAVMVGETITWIPIR